MSRNMLTFPGHTESNYSFTDLGGDDARENSFFFFFDYILSYKLVYKLVNLLLE